ncbi:MAG: hypothetical protein JO370_04240 [Paucibacter sp.]|nr:hypothetical protein [Roseateles sp.]
MNKKFHAVALSAMMLALLSACGGGGGSSGSSGSAATATPSSVNVQTMLSDAASEDWSNISVNVLAINLVDANNNLTPITLPSSPYNVNLTQLDNLAEMINGTTLTNSTASPITYTGVQLVISANPGDVGLTVSGNPESGFPVAAGTIVPSGQIQIQGASGSSGSQTVTIPVNFASPLVIPAASANPSTGTVAPINIEFDLANPAFIIGHTVAGSGSIGASTIWAVNFNGPVHHKPIGSVTNQVLRHMYGSVTSVSTDNLTLNIDRATPTLPLVSPETAQISTQALAIKVDAANGTLFYNLDAAKPVAPSTIKDFSSVSSILAAGEFVRVAARYQQDGSLVATRIYASSTFNTVFISPEGHVLHVNPNTNTITVDNASGKPVKVQVTSNTQFFFRTPTSGLADSTPIGTGTGFLASKYLARGFKVHLQVVDPLASPLQAQTVDIESAPYEGTISNVVQGSSFDITKAFATAADDYTDLVLNFISSGTGNGVDASGNPVTGFKYWNFAYPTQYTLDPTESSFAQLVGQSVNFGGTAGAAPVYGITHAVWGSTGASTTGWLAPSVVLMPLTLPKGTVASGLVASANAGISTFGLSVKGGSTPVNVNVNANAGSATLVYQVDRSNGVVTVSPIDITTSGGMNALTTNLAIGARVDVSGIPQGNNTNAMAAYVLKYYTGTQPE